ncbi:MAG: hypothetical protein M1828_003799 [Chrysothrix sp. TS-e1954]|nr:MAG: hypothetical protein M1828_003799 [Chrysothrix sp. TS-e1954]
MNASSSITPRRRRRPPRPGQLNSLSPLRILTQIALLQTSYYVAATILLVFTALAAGKPPLGMGLLLDWTLIRGDVTDGWMLGVVWGLVGLVTFVFSTFSPQITALGRCKAVLTINYRVIPLLLLIARSKLIPDFALTIHLLHLLATSLYTRSIPSNFFWWLLQAASAGLMTFLGIWSCRWRELRPITFGGHGGGVGGGHGDGGVGGGHGVGGEGGGHAGGEGRKGTDEEEGIGLVGRGEGIEMADVKG